MEKYKIFNRKGDVIVEGEAVSFKEFVERNKKNLVGADLYKANLRKADLQGADLEGADLSGANLSGANFREEISQDLEQKLLEDSKAMEPGSGVSFHQFKEPDARILKTFDSPEQTLSFIVTFSTKELTALCPLTSMPDYYMLEIEYMPNQLCIESKSAKFYFHSFRDAGMFIEALTNKIADDWNKICKPKYLKVTNTMAARGGIPITVVVERGCKK